MNLRSYTLHTFTPWALGVICIVCVFYPMGILLSDEYSYLTLSQRLGEYMGITINNYDKSLLINYQNYNLGFPFLLSVITTLGIKWAFLVNGILVLLSIYLMSKLLDLIHLDKYWAFALALFFPVVLYSRLLMSEMSVMLIGILFLLNAFQQSPKALNYFFMGLLASLSFWFREGTVILFAPMIVFFIIKDLSRVPFMLFGILMGVLPIMLQWGFYNNVGLRDTGVNFGIGKIYSNILMILYVFTIVFPAGLYIMAKSKIKFKLILSTSILGYVTMHMLYEYNGLDSSGVKSFLLFPRFFICLAPIMLLFYADFFQKMKVRILFPLSWAFVLSIYGLLYFVDLQYEKVRGMVYSQVGAGVLNCTGGINEISKILLPERGELRLNKIDITSKDIINPGEYLLQIERSDKIGHKLQTNNIFNAHRIDSIFILGHLKYNLYKY